MADIRRRRPPADAWRTPVEGHVRRCVDTWVATLTDEQLRVADASILEILDVCGLLLNGASAAEQDQEQAS